jgi:hypothetical protein
MIAVRPIIAFICAGFVFSGCDAYNVSQAKSKPTLQFELLGDLGRSKASLLALPPDSERQLASLYKRGIAAEIALIDRRGSVTEWMGSDGVTLRFDSGILTGTTGLSADLYSAEVSPVMDAMAKNGGRYSRVFRHLNGERMIQIIEADCSLTLLPHREEFTEVCRVPGGTFTNRFRVETATTRIVASRQWISREAGYIGLNPYRNP